MKNKLNVTDIIYVLIDNRIAKAIVTSILNEIDLIDIHKMKPNEALASGKNHTISIGPIDKNHQVIEFIQTSEIGAIYNFDNDVFARGYIKDLSLFTWAHTLEDLKKKLFEPFENESCG